MPTPSRAVLWLRRDLRLADHPALLTALERSDEVVPLFVLDDRLRGAGDVRLAFLRRCLRDLSASMDGHLVVRAGRPADVVPAAVAEAAATEVVVTGDFTPYGAARDAEVEAALPVPLTRVGSPYAVDPGTVTTAAGRGYAVFTPFRRAWLQTGWKPPAPTPDDPPWASLPSEPVPDDPPVDAALPPAGERAAHDRLAAFLDCDADDYHRTRDVPGADATSRLSPYLKYGCLHPRQVLAELGDAAGHESLRNELAWREFYADVLHRRPETAWRPLRADVGAIETDAGPLADERFTAWAEGRTGYPIVDAGMRQLRTEGWVHNRVRMIVASFLVKDLHLPWQRGARWFLQHLVDGDVASNNHGWQWVAGTGTDPAPYFRIFNPVTQGERFDPDGAYVRHHVPELAGLTGKAVHRPWTLPDGPPGRYPAPVVDHADERREALRRYEDVTGRAGGRG